MPSLNSQPGSITARQMQRLHGLARKRGMDHEALRVAIGCPSLSDLCAAEASVLITHLGGGDLPNPPGRKPRPPRSRRRPGGNTVRMITQDQIEQIHRLGLAYFALRKRDSELSSDRKEADSCQSSASAFAAWLTKDFKLERRASLSDQIRGLGTAARAGEVIRVLKEMCDRIGGGAPATAEPSRDRKEAEASIAEC